jgi:hypothetical protein
MSKKVLILMAVVLVLSVIPLQAAQSVSWDGGGDGSSWEDATNWDPNIVPENDANTFVVTIDGGAEGVGVRLSQGHTISSLNTYSDVCLESGTWHDIDFTILNGITNHGFLEIENLDIYGKVTNIGNAILEAEDWTIQDANLYNQAGGTVHIQCGKESFDVEGGGFLNSGTVLITPGGDCWIEYEFQNSGLIEIYGGTCSSDQAFRNESTAVIKGYGAIHSSQVINNAGLIRSLGGGLVLHSAVDFGNDPNNNSGITNTGTLTNSPGTSLTVIVRDVPDVNNQGTIEVNADGSVVFDCNNLNNEPNGIIKLLGGTLAATTIIQKADANFAGFGGITGNVVIDPNASIKLTGPTNIVGDVNIAANAILEISDGTTLITGHTTNNGTIHMKGGRLIPQGGITNNGQIIWEPGLYNNIADFNLDGQVNFKDFADFADTWLWQAEL